MKQLLLALLLAFPYVARSTAPEAPNIIPLSRGPASGHLRRVPKPPSYDEEVEWLPVSIKDRLRELIFGKSDETLYMEGVLQNAKQRRNKSRKHLEASGDPYDQDFDLGKYYWYWVTLYCGSEAEPLEVIYDTGSDWLITQSSSRCENCDGEAWNDQDSSTYEQDYVYFNLIYGSLEVYGYYSHDSFYLDSAQTFGVDDFGFNLVTWQDGGLSPYGGIIGFSRDFPFDDGYEDVAHGPLFTYALVDAGAISDPIFASYLSDVEGDSFLQFGDYDEIGTFYDGDLVWTPMTRDDYFWITTSSAYTIYGDTETYDPFEVILDTGTSLAYTDKVTGKKMQRQLAKGHRGFKFMGQWYMKCDLEKFESIFLELGGYFFEIPPESYVLELSDYDWKWCDLGFYSDEESDQWLVGDVLFRGYYNVWDDENDQVGWAPRTDGIITTLPYAS